MSTTEELERLAEQVGIEPAYADIWNQQHVATVETKRALLDALGFPVGDDAALAASLIAFEERPWRRALPPVCVVRAGETPSVPLITPNPPPDELAAAIVTEDGTRQPFTIRPATLPEAARRTVDGRPFAERTLTLPADLPFGYHSVEIPGLDSARMTLIVAPVTCWLPEPGSAGDHGGLWGVQTHLYTLRSDRNWGVGDFTDLADLAVRSARLGAAAIGVNPLHALFPLEPDRASPYSPSSRLFLNPLYIDPERIPEYAGSAPAQSRAAGFAEELADVRAAPLIDYAAVARIKYAVLEALFDDLNGGTALAADRALAFAEFRATHGVRLDRFGVFSALSEHFEGAPWTDWPVSFRDPASTDVAAFAARNRNRVDFHVWLQWLADEQLGTAAAAGRDAGLVVGLYGDLAVGVDPGGADAWADQAAYVAETRVGCPPDPFAMLGQDWGTPPLNPLVLADTAYEPFIAMVRASMRHAGALRIDHAMGLMHLYWIPPELPPAAGAYMSYPFEDLLGIVALESQRHRCLVVGEDLGTVPAGFRERMAAAHILSYRVFYFEKDGDRFKRPHEYPALALACVTTHDLATLAGFWSGADIRLRERLGLYPSAAVEQSEWENRIIDRRLMLEALADEGVLTDERTAQAAGDGDLTADLVAAVHSYLSRSPARLVMVQIDDVTGEVDQLNLPSTTDEYPNWRRKLSKDLGAAVTSPLMGAVCRALSDRADAGAAP